MEQEYQNNNLDIYQQKLESNKTALFSCQKENNLNSCLKCDKVLSCQIRQDYVASVYESMNKGQVGSFDFN